MNIIFQFPPSWIIGYKETEVTQAWKCQDLLTSTQGLDCVKLRKQSSETIQVQWMWEPGDHIQRTLASAMIRNGLWGMISGVCHRGKWYQIYTVPGFYGVIPLWRILLYSLCQRPWPHPVCEVGACFVKGPDQDDGHYRAGIQTSEAYSQAQWWRLLIHVSNYIFFCFLDKGTKKYGAYFSGFSGCSKVFFFKIEGCSFI